MMTRENMWTVLNECFNIQCKLVMDNLFTLLGYHVEPNSKSIVEAEASTKKYIDIR